MWWYVVAMKIDVSDELLTGGLPLEAIFRGSKSALSPVYGPEIIISPIIKKTYRGPTPMTISPGALRKTRRTVVSAAAVPGCRPIADR